MPRRGWWAPTQTHFELSQVYSCLDARVRPLVVVIKQWAKRRGVADASNGTLSAYAWANLVIFFLQQPLFKTASGGRLQPILPNVQSEKLINAARVALGDAIACPGSGPNVSAAARAMCHCRRDCGLNMAAVYRERDNLRVAKCHLSRS